METTYVVRPLGINLTTPIPCKTTGPLIQASFCIPKSLSLQPVPHILEPGEEVHWSFSGAPEW